MYLFNDKANFENTIFAACVAIQTAHCKFKLKLSKDLVLALDSNTQKKVAKLIFQSATKLKSFNIFCVILDKAKSLKLSNLLTKVDSKNFDKIMTYTTKLSFTRVAVSKE